jgi:hypothetical protein
MGWFTWAFGRWRLARRNSGMGFFEDPLDFTLLAALLLSIVHLLGPLIRQGLSRRSELVASFGGGLAVGYVFLQLFPEVELAHEWFGTHVHLITLVSFLAFYGFEALLHKRHLTALHRNHSNSQTAGEAPHDHPTHVFWWHVALSWFYTWMVIFALPEETGENLGLAVLGAVSVGMHLIYKDYILRTHHDESFQTKGRYLLAIAPFAGWAAHLIIAPPEIVFDLFIAVLAGILMQGVFQDELPKREAARLSWLYGGAATFALLSLLTTT